MEKDKKNERKYTYKIRIETDDPEASCVKRIEELVFQGFCVIGACSDDERMFTSIHNLSGAELCSAIDSTHPLKEAATAVVMANAITGLRKHDDDEADNS